MYKIELQEYGIKAIIDIFKHCVTCLTQKQPDVTKLYFYLKLLNPLCDFNRHKEN